MFCSILNILGTFKELQESGLDFTKMLGENKSQEEKPPEHEMRRQLSVKSVASTEVEDPREIEEQKSAGSVGAYVYKSYFRAGGNVCVIFILFVLFVTAQLFASAADYFLTLWYVIIKFIRLRFTNNL